MKPYPKIQSVFKRDIGNNSKSFIMGDWSIPEFEYLSHTLWQATEKIDGTNIRISRDIIQGRTDNAQIHSGLLNTLTEIQDSLRSSTLPPDTVLYGEGYGSKIQSGESYLKDSQSFALFDVMISGNYLTRNSVEDIAQKLKIDVCPIVGKPQSLLTWVNDVEQKMYLNSLLCPTANSEGVVLRPLIELQTRNGSRVITKLKFKDFN